MTKHRKLTAWQKSMLFIHLVYRASRTFPREELYGLTSQLRKAAVSVASNIAEGHARYGAAEFAHALSIALGSLAECDTLLQIALDEGYLTSAQHEEIQAALIEAGKTTMALQKSVRPKTDA
jgi:four helix bundle protein